MSEAFCKIIYIIRLLKRREKEELKKLTEERGKKKERGKEEPDDVNNFYKKLWSHFKPWVLLSILIGYIVLWKLHVWEKSGSKFRGQNWFFKL